LLTKRKTEIGKIFSHRLWADTYDERVRSEFGQKSKGQKEWSKFLNP